MARFVVDLGDIEMTEKQEAALAGAIQKVALAHVAEVGAEKPFLSYFPREWYGYILRHQLDGLLDAHKELGRAYFGK